jgi:iron complex transport system ATP-binding protein
VSAVLAAESVTYRVGSSTLVEDVSLDLAPGRVTVVVGPNGAGKSTLVRLLSGEIEPAAGRVRYGDADLRAMAPWRLACTRAVLPQSSRLAFPFTAGEIVRIGLDGIGRGLSRAAREAIVLSAMRQAEILHLAPRRFQSLSGGEQQRTQFARVLAQLEAGRTVCDRQVLLLDEPIASLDLKHQLSLLRAARELAGAGVAVLAVLHDLNLAAAFADEMLVLSRGRAFARGTPHEVVTSANVAAVFEVDLEVGATPPEGQPFLLPRRAAAVSGAARIVARSPQ